MLEQILLETSAPSSRALMVGDTSADIFMAHNAKVTSCAACWDCSIDKHELISAKPTYTINSIQELENIL